MGLGSDHFFAGLNRPDINLISYQICHGQWLKLKGKRRFPNPQVASCRGMMLIIPITQLSL